MALTIINQLQERLRSCAIAGTALLADDFRLRRVAQQFTAISGSSPVLARIQTLLDQLLAPDCPQPQAALLETLALVNAVACVQASSDAPAIEQPITCSSGRLHQARHSQLQPLLDALTQKGSGRYAVLEAAAQEDHSVFFDFRLRRAWVNALGDSSSDISLLALETIVQQGEVFLPLLKQGFDRKGKKAMALRLRAIGQIAGSKEDAFYRDLLEKSSPQVLEEAIDQLYHNPGNLETLTDLALHGKTRTKELALDALILMDTPESRDFFYQRARPSSIDDAAAFSYLARLCGMSTPEAADLVADGLELLLKPLYDGSIEPQSIDELLSHCLPAIAGKSSPRLTELLAFVGEHWKIFNQKVGRVRLAPITLKIAGGNERNDDLNVRYYRQFLEEFSLTGAINRLLINDLFCDSDGGTRRMVEALFQHCNRAYLPAALTSAFLTDPAHAYDLFAPFCNEPEPAKSILGVLEMLLCLRPNAQFTGSALDTAIRLRAEHDQPLISGMFYLGTCARYGGDSHGITWHLIGEQLDPRWFSFLCGVDEQVYEPHRTLQLLQRIAAYPTPPELVLPLQEKLLCLCLAKKELPPAFLQQALILLSETGYQQFRELIPRIAYGKTTPYGLTSVLPVLPLTQEERDEILCELLRMVHAGEIRDRNNMMLHTLEHLLEH